jgi:branched-chain amino acid transport system permease protein
VTLFSGFGGITGIDPPDFFLDDPVRIYYAGLGLSVLAYFGFKALERTSFGVALRGVRDDPIRMSSLGFSPPLLRMVAFTIAGFVAAVSGVLNVWWNGQIDPTSISTGPTLELLIIAVMGGIAHLEGAWIGAFVFVVAGNYLRNLPLVHMVGITEARFNTVVGLLVLLILVISPTGLAGLPAAARDAWRRFMRWRSPESKEDVESDTTRESHHHADSLE